MKKSSLLKMKNLPATEEMLAVAREDVPVKVGSGWNTSYRCRYEQYDQWSENARLAREEYVRGKLTAEDFLRKIDITHELTSYEVDKIDLPDGPSMWQRLVARDFRFDPERYFPEEMAYLNLNLNDPDPQWLMLTADDLRREAQKGHQSLKEKNGK